MADWQYREVVTRKRIWYLTSPAPYEEVEKAVVRARQEYEKVTGKSANWGNIPMISSYDDEVHIWFEIQEDP